MFPYRYYLLEEDAKLFMYTPNLAWCRPYLCELSSYEGLGFLRRLLLLRSRWPAKKLPSLVCLVFVGNESMLGAMPRQISW